MKKEKEILFLYSDLKFKDYIKENSKDIFDNAFFLKKNTLSEKDFLKYKNIKKISVFVDTDLNKKTLIKFKNLKIICTRSTGINHIDTEYCQDKKIKILSVSNYGSITVAEYAMSGLLYLLKNFDSNIKWELNRGLDLSKKTVGILGAGKIGKEFIKLLKPFGCNILVCDIFLPKKEIEEKNVKKVSFDKMIKESDILSLHLPLCNNTKHIISSREFKKMKDGIFIVNTSRGGLINSKNLYDNLKNGKISKAHLDVLEFENDLNLKSLRNLNIARKNIFKINKKIIKLKNVFYTKHQAYNTKEAVERIWKKTLENLQD